MERIPSSRNVHPLAGFPIDVAPRGLDAEFRLRGQVDDLCIALFDYWCERRELTPLIYLLHAWPFLPSTPRAVETLSAALRDLRIFHEETLDDLGRQLIDDIQALGGG